jgi:hypothetical protein
MSDWVSQREFDRLEGTVNEVHKDVKTLLAAYNRDQGADAERRELLEATRDKGARKLAWGGIVMGAIGGLWWVQDAIAKLGHS